MQLSFFRATIPGPGFVDVSDIFSEDLPGGTGGIFLADSLKGHGVLPSKRLIISGIINPETQAAFKQGIPASDSLLGRMAAKALKHLGIEPLKYRYEVIKGKLGLVIETE